MYAWEERGEKRKLDLSVDVKKSIVARTTKKIKELFQLFFHKINNKCLKNVFSSL